MSLWYPTQRIQTRISLWFQKRSATNRNYFEFQLCLLPVASDQWPSLRNQVPFLKWIKFHILVSNRLQTLTHRPLRKFKWGKVLWELKSADCCLRCLPKQQTGKDLDTLGRKGFEKSLHVYLKWRKDSTVYRISAAKPPSQNRYKHTIALMHLPRQSNQNRYWHTTVPVPPAMAQLSAAGWQSWSVNILMSFLIYRIGLMSLAFVRHITIKFNWCSQASHKKNTFTVLITGSTSPS